ncbi:hypothetical protein CSV61_08500 [Sporosarcina sp. P3]|nr:hypothetical protein CSV61_08500 [Sporosarcina sp. P3]
MQSGGGCAAHTPIPLNEIKQGGAARSNIQLSALLTTLSAQSTCWSALSNRISAQFQRWTALSSAPPAHTPNPLNEIKQGGAARSNILLSALST